MVVRADNHTIIPPVKCLEDRRHPVNTPEHCNCRAGIFPAQMDKQLQDELRLVGNTAVCG